MELGNKIIKDARQSARLQDDLNSDVMSLKGQISIDSQNLSMLRKEGSNLATQLTNIQETIKSLREQEQFLIGTRDALNKAELWRSYFKKFIAKMEPSDGEMTTMFNEMQSRYLTLLQKYEQKLEYKQIVEAEATTRDLTKMVSEKRNELMKLETEREY